MHWRRGFRRIVFGKSKAIDLESQLTIATCFVVAVSSLFSSIGNYYLGLHTMMYTTLGLMILSATCYLCARLWKLNKQVYFAIFGVSVIFLNTGWFFNYGSRGPMLYFFIIIYAFFIFIWNPKKVAFVSLFFFLNLLVLFILEYRFPDFTGHYPEEQIRIVDVYAGNLLSMALMLIFGISIKSSYLKQYQKARNSEQLKTAFLANISHEIRTPLNAIVGFSSLLTTGNFERDEQKDFQRIIMLNSEHLLQLIEDIIDLSKLEANNFQLDYRKIDLEQLFAKLKKKYSHYLADENKKISLEYELLAQHKLICTDLVSLEQIMRKLLENAIKFTWKGTIRFGCRLEHETHLFYVKDTGVGIREENQDRIFERFVKIDEDDSRLYPGTGIGLFLSKQLVEKLGGEIWVESRHGEGATFYFTLKNQPFPVLYDDLHSETLALNPFSKITSDT